MAMEGPLTLYKVVNEHTGEEYYTTSEWDAVRSVVVWEDLGQDTRVYKGDWYPEQADVRVD